MENMLCGAEAPAQMQPTFGAIRNTPLIALKPAPLTCRLSAELAALNMPKTADMEQKSFRIGKGVLMGTSNTDTLGAAGYLLSAPAAHERIFVGTISGA